MAIPVQQSARAQSAKARVFMAFEATRGVSPETAASYYPVRRDSLTIGVAETWDADADLQNGRDPTLPTLQMIDGSFSMAVGIDKRLFGAHVGALLGTPVVTDAKAYGYLQFRKEGVESGDTVTINGVGWTFTAGSASGDETEIQTTVAATVAQLATDLNASADTDIAAATYVAAGWRLFIEADVTGAAGNAITIAAAEGVADVSAATLVGGGLYRHVFKSGADALPSVSFATEHTDLEEGSHRFPVLYGAVYNQMSIAVEPTGRATATFSGLAINERERETAIVGSGAKALAYERFSQLQGGLQVDDECVCGVVQSGTVEYSNGLDTDRTLGCGFDQDAGAITEALPGAASASFRAQTRFYSEKLHGQATATRDPLKVYWMLFDPVDGSMVKITLNQVTFPRAAKEHRTGSTIGVNLQGLASGEGVAMLEVEIINDVAEYS